ncbi:Transposase [Vibrio thalassae]|uniref:Transposase n=1 Tax=Vibrio thalassae TaxID=1243014 RepID=A0A240EK84_9VIBR|nr:Transposase [Vibrio thalassae]
MTKRQRRTFSSEFKVDGASLVLDKGYSISEAARSLDIGDTALRRWVDQLKIERGGETPTVKVLCELFDVASSYYYEFKGCQSHLVSQPS